MIQLKCRNNCNDLTLALVGLQFKISQLELVMTQLAIVSPWNLPRQGTHSGFTYHDQLSDKIVKLKKNK